MSTQTNKDVSCPHCGAAVKTQMYPGIDAEENQELRALVLDETLFDWKCPACGYEAQLVYPCLYHDNTLNYMVYVVPNGNDCALASVDVEKEFPQFTGMKKRVVTSLAGLKEKILIFEAGLDDLAVELAKLALTDVAGKKHSAVVDSCYFCSMDETAQRIVFSFFLHGQAEPVIQGIRMDVYEKSLEIVQKVGRPGGEFCTVDVNTAQEVLRTYREEE